MALACCCLPRCWLAVDSEECKYYTCQQALALGHAQHRQGRPDTAIQSGCTTPATCENYPGPVVHQAQAQCSLPQAGSLPVEQLPLLPIQEVDGCHFCIRQSAGVLAVGANMLQKLAPAASACEDQPRALQLPQGCCCSGGNAPASQQAAQMPTDAGSSFPERRGAAAQPSCSL